MRFRSLVAVVVSILVALFFVLNWHLFATPVHVSFLVTAGDAPVGLVMLGLFALVLVVLSSYLGVWQGTLLMEFRRQGKELQAQRTLAENAEASRFTELGNLVREELSKSAQHVDATIESLRTELRATENSLAATLAEMDDRYRRTGLPRSG